MCPQTDRVNVLCMKINFLAQCQSCLCVLTTKFANFAHLFQSHHFCIKGQLFDFWLSAVMNALVADLVANFTLV